MRGAWCSSTEVSTNRSGRPVVSISGKIGSTPQMRLNEGVTTAEANRVTELEREVRELRRANEIPKLASAFFAQAEPEHVKVVVASIKQPEAAYSMRSPRHWRCRRAQG
ncbi:hypothetical protein SAMN04489709_12571 [Paracidovorax citrulli]|nr:hypothetical protein SAMN04489709_12571 [Paracidovorax citrulli]